MLAALHSLRSTLALVPAVCGAGAVHLVRVWQLSQCGDSL